MSKVIFSIIMDGDLETKISGTPYSTSPREVITVGDMMKFHEREVGEV